MCSAAREDADAQQIRSDELLELGSGAGVWSADSIAELKKLGQFDIVRCAGCLDNVEDVDAAMKAIEGSLKPNEQSVALITAISERGSLGIDDLRWVINKITGGE